MGGKEKKGCSEINIIGENRQSFKFQLQSEHVIQLGQVICRLFIYAWALRSARVKSNLLF